MALFNRDKIILDLCGGTGAWSKPYKDAGYDVRVITLPENDVCLYKPQFRVYGILAAPPCTHFSGSGALYWDEKDRDGRTLKDLNIVAHCCRIILMTKPHFWCLENPVGRLKRWIGEPVAKFNPCDYGDAFTKKTLLWGNFNIPFKDKKVQPVEVPSQDYSSLDVFYGIEKQYHSPEKAAIRSITPPGFAKAFFEANP